MRQSWTDDRLDDFRAEVNCRFDRIDADLREVRDAVYSMQRAMLQVGGGLLVTFIVGFTGILVAQL